MIFIRVVTHQRGFLPTCVYLFYPQLQLLDWADTDSMIREILDFTRSQLRQKQLTTVSPYAALPALLSATATAIITAMITVVTTTGTLIASINQTPPTTCHCLADTSLYWRSTHQR
jgi:hypothetical protein